MTAAVSEAPAKGLDVRGLRKSFLGREVLKGVDLTVAPGEIVGLVGRSGVGKSTLARCLVGLERPDAGTIALDGAAIVPGRGPARRRIQYLWQDSAQALSPYLTAAGAVLETLNGFAVGSPAERPARAAALLTELGLPADAHRRRPHALSGGQCQRTALARALAAEPQLVILDEPFASLDLAAQIDAIKALRRVHEQTGLAMLIVSHDLAPLRHLTGRIVRL